MNSKTMAMVGLFVLIVLAGFNQGGISGWVLISLAVFAGIVCVLFKVPEISPGLGGKLWIPLIILALFQLYSLVSVPFELSKSMPGFQNSIWIGDQAQQDLQGKSFEQTSQEAVQGVPFFSAKQPESRKRALDSGLGGRAVGLTLLFLLLCFASERLLAEIGRKPSGLILCLIGFAILGLMLWLRLTLLGAGTPILWGPFNSNHRALVILLVLPHLLSPLSGRWSRKTPGSEKMGLFICALAILGVGILLIGKEHARGTLISLGVGGGLFLWSWLLLLFPKNNPESSLSPKKFWIWLIGPVVAVLPVLFFVPKIILNMQQEKIIAYRYCLNLFRNHLGFGVGPGQFPLFAPEVENIQLEKTFLYGESSFLQLLAENGLFGGILALWCVLLLAISWANASRTISIRKIRRALPFLAFAPGIALSGMTEFGFTLPFSLLLLALYLTRGCQLLNLSGKKQKTWVAKGVPLAATLVALFLFFSVGFSRPTIVGVTPWFRSQVLTQLYEHPELKETALRMCFRYRLWGLRNQISGRFWGESSLAFSKEENEKGIELATWSGRFHPQPIGFSQFVFHSLGGQLFGGFDEKILTNLEPRNLLTVLPRYQGFCRRTFRTEFLTSSVELGGPVGDTGVFGVESRYENAPENGWEDYRFPVMDLVPPGQGLWVALEGHWPVDKAPPEVRVYGTPFASGKIGTLTTLRRLKEPNSDVYWYGPFLPPEDVDGYLIEGIHLDIMPTGGTCEINRLEVWYKPPSWM